VAGFTTVVAMLGLLSGTMMLSLGIIGEYLGRLHVRSMQRPAYLVRAERMPMFTETSEDRACSCGATASQRHDQGSR
jgi:hypothetical protein